MDMYKQNWTRLQKRVFRFLSMNTGKPLNQRQIAKSLKFSPTAVAKALRKLNEEKLIKVERQGDMNLRLVELNRDNQKSIELKRVDNLEAIYESGIVEFLEERFPGTTIVIFGSYSRGEDTHDSDIDIAIIGTRGKETDTEKFDRILKKEIRINFYQNWREIDKNLRDNILNGITLAGGIEL